MFQLLISHRPRLGSAYNDLAALLIRNGRLGEARPLLENALDMLAEPQAVAAAHANLGMLLAEASRYSPTLHLTRTLM